MNTYPLYDVPWLVRDPNDSYMSLMRYKIELRNQAIVDDYFISRSQGLCAKEARKQVADKHQVTPKRAKYILDWFYHEALKRKKYDFLEKFPLSKEH